MFSPLPEKAMFCSNLQLFTESIPKSWAAIAPPVRAEHLMN